MKFLQLTSNKESFKTIKFKSGFNFVLAERDKDSGNKDSTNGLGKSLLLEILDYCLGSNPSETLKKDEMKSWVFTLDVEINGENVRLTRPVDDINNMYVYEGAESIGLPVSTSWNYTVDSVKIALGEKLFGLNNSIIEGKNKPSYRSLFSYFMRTGSSAFTEPFAYFAKQPTWSKQVNNAYLLGLDWELSTKLSQLKVKLEKLDKANTAIENGALNDFGGTVGELESEKINIQSELDLKQGRLKSFQVLDDYKEIQKKSDELTKRIHELLNEVTINNQIVEKYQGDLENETDEKLRVEEIYREAGAVFNSSSIKTITEVEDFHRRVVTNRKNYLRAEIDNFKSGNAKLHAQISKLTSERGEFMNILESHGALEEYSLLQNEVNKERAKISDIESKINRLTEIEEMISSLRVDIENMTQKMRRDYSERLPTIATAVKMFNANSQYLYKNPGTFSIDITKDGYKFKVDIKKAGSDGVTNMKVLCYDLMLAEYWSNIVKKEIPLFHDSKIFADVDPRQIALALELAKTKSEELGFQYICSMNSSYVPNEFLSDEFKSTLKDFTIVTYHDKDATGTLLGVEF